MVDVKEIIIYECPTCSNYHSDEYDAKNCCSINELGGFQCGNCGECYDNHHDADECCGEDKP